MKIFKAKIPTLIAALLLAAVLFSIAAVAAERYNNVSKTNEYFSISSGGSATVTAKYEGIQNVTTGATVHIKLQRQFLWFWWTDVSGAEWTDQLSGWQNSATHSVTLSETGSYRAVIDYTVRGSGGSPDEIQKIVTANY